MLILRNISCSTRYSDKYLAPAEQFYSHYTVREHIHNHPRNTPYPSGLDDGKSDIGFSRSIGDLYSNTYPNREAPIFKIYTPKNEKYIQYDKHSKYEDFLPTLNEVIITTKKN